MTAARDFPDRLGLVSLVVVRGVEVPLTFLSMLAVDEKHRRAVDPADEILEARRRLVVREERCAGRGCGVRGKGGPLVAPRHVEKLVNRPFTRSLGDDSFESSRLRRGLDP